MADEETPVDDTNGDTNHWKPPTEEEQKLLQLKRERSDKISKLMSQYLLKGHKMLATTCDICTTIELEDKSGRKHCIGCEEIDGRPLPGKNDHPSGAAGQSKQSEPVDGGPESPIIIAGVAVSDSMEVVVQKLRKATQALAVTESVELSRDYVALIKDCADAIIVLRKAET